MEPPTSLQRVDIIDETVSENNDNVNDENTSDNLAPIFLKQVSKETKPQEPDIPTTVPENMQSDGHTKSSRSSYCQWELKYSWAYFNNLKDGWFCKTCEEYSNSGDAYWKTLPRKHDDHPSRIFYDHDTSTKHLAAIKNKKVVQSMLSKGAIYKQLRDASKTQSIARRDRNRRIIGKFFKTTYFLAKKKWAMFNFEDVIKYLNDLGDEDIGHHLRNAPKNATYMSSVAVEEFLKLIGDRLTSVLLQDLNSSVDFTILADESTDDGDRSQLAIFIRIIGNDNKPIERFLGLTRVGTSKTAATIMELIHTFLRSKEIECSYIRFCGLDGTNSMSSERCGLQRLIRHSSPHAQYINCRNHRLALCFVHLLKISKDWRLFYRTPSVDRKFKILIIQVDLSSIVFITNLNATYILSFYEVRWLFL